MPNQHSVNDLCKLHAITPDEIANQTGFDRSRVLAIVEGRWTPSPAERDKVAGVFGLARGDVAWGHKTPIQHIYGSGPA